MPARLTPTGTKPHSRKIDGTGRVWTKPSRLFVAADLGVFYDDSGTGTIVVGGSATQSFAISDARSGTVVVSGVVPSESNIHTGLSDYQDASTIEFTLMGSGTQSSEHTSSGTGTVRFQVVTAYPGAFYPGQAYPSQTATAGSTETHDSAATGTVAYAGSSVASHDHVDQATGSMTFSGVSTRSSSHTSAATATVTVSGTATESYQSGAGPIEYNDASTGTLALSGTSTGSHIYTDSRTATLVLSGTGSAPNTDSVTLEELLVGWIATAVTGYPSAATTGRMSRPRTGSLA